MTAVAEAAAVKACCASLYENELTGWLLGESFHPGGAALTDRLAEILGVSAGQQVLDVAAGPGTSALRIATVTEASVHGVDLSAALVAAATERARSSGLAGRVTFGVGDAEHLPVDDDSVDAVICECALCIFPEKADAVREMARVVRAGGRVGIADVVMDRRRLPPELDTLAGRVACLADARTLEENLCLLEDAGLRIDAVERHDEALGSMLDRVDARLAAARMAFPSAAAPFDLPRARGLLSLARQVVDDGAAGYVLIAAVAPEAEHG
jgi:hypothetical protein